VIAVTERRSRFALSVGNRSKREGDHAMTQDRTTQNEPAELIERAKRNERTELAEHQLAEVAGGLVFTFKLVAVKTISWAHD
jgi:hypothetical protein